MNKIYMFREGNKVMRRKECQNDLFKEELGILKSANENLEHLKYKDNELLEQYRELAESYDKLLRLTKKVFKISDAQGKELKRRENDIKNLLNSSNQGFLMFEKNLLVTKEYSLECIRIFDKKIANLNIAELLAGTNQEQGKMFEYVFMKVFETQDIEKRYACLKDLPSMLKINEKDISIIYKLVGNSESENGDDALMLILTDLTENRKAQDQVLYLSYHDALTSLYNRTYVDSITHQLQSSVSMPLSIIMVDMNGLKLTNDVFGHEFGDRMLVNLSGILQSCCRKSDFVVRWGGDEFLVIMPNADSSVCRKVCNRIIESCSTASEDPISVSVSLGMATIEKAGFKLSEIINIAENMMYNNKLSESKRTRRKIITSIERILHTRCFEDPGHIERIKKMAGNFAKVLGITAETTEMLNLTMLATLHDIGKVAIPTEILGKHEALTKNEWEIMKTHTEAGFRMAQSIEEPLLAQAILGIRERWDGKGYPYGLENDQIPFIARVISIIDVYDVITHDRPYRKALSQREARKEFEKCSGKQFDPHLVKLFLDNFDAIIADS
jgi:diguanylate cyclase (GGDEF)-like protein